MVISSKCSFPSQTITPLWSSSPSVHSLLRPPSLWPSIPSVHSLLRLPPLWPSIPSVHSGVRPSHTYGHLAQVYMKCRVKSLHRYDHLAQPSTLESNGHAPMVISPRSSLSSQTAVPVRSACPSAPLESDHHTCVVIWHMCELVPRVNQVDHLYVYGHLVQASSRLRASLPTQLVPTRLFNTSSSDELVLGRVN